MKYLVIFVLVIFANGASAKPMPFKLYGNGGNCAGCEWVSADGDITNETPKKLEKFFEDNKINFSINVVMNSRGGSLIASFEVGRTLRRYRATTSIGKTVKDGFGHHETVEGKCISACAYAYLGGEERYSKKGLGFHQFYDKRILSGADEILFSAEDRVLDQYVSGGVVGYLTEMGIDSRLFSLASKTRPEDVYYLSEDEMMKYGILPTSSSTTSWEINPLAGGIVAQFITQEPKARSVMLYCQSDNPSVYHLLMAIPFDYFKETNKAIRQMLKSHTGKSFIFNEKYKVVQSNYQLAEGDSPVLFNFLVTRDGAVSIIEEARFVLSDSRGVANANQPIFDMLSYYEINGEKKYPYVSLKNCTRNS